MNFKVIAFGILVLVIFISSLPQTDSVFTGTMRRKGKKVFEICFKFLASLTGEKKPFSMCVI